MLRVVFDEPIDVATLVVVLASEAVLGRADMQRVRAAIGRHHAEDGGEVVSSVSGNPAHRCASGSRVPHLRNVVFKPVLVGGGQPVKRDQVHRAEMAAAIRSNFPHASETRPSRLRSSLRWNGQVTTTWYDRWSGASYSAPLPAS